MGGGDRMRGAAIGCGTGWQALRLLLLLASAGGIGWALSVQRKGDRSLAERRVPFGVFLCTAAFAAVPEAMERASRALGGGDPATKLYELAVGLGAEMSLAKRGKSGRGHV